MSRIWSQIKNRKVIYEWKNPWKYSVKIDEIDLFFYEYHKEKMKVDKNECEYILFRFDVCFTEYLLAVEIDEPQG